MHPTLTTPSTPPWLLPSPHLDYYQYPTFTTPSTPPWLLPAPHLDYYQYPTFTTPSTPHLPSRPPPAYTGRVVSISGGGSLAVTHTIGRLPVLYCTTCHCTALHCLYCTVLHYMALYFTVLHVSVLYCIAWHCTQYNVLHCQYTKCSVHCTVLNYMTNVCTSLRGTAMHGNKQGVQE